MEVNVTSELERCWALCCHGEMRAALNEGTRMRDLAIERGWPEAAAQASSMIAWFCFQVGEAELGIEHAYAAKKFWAEAHNTEREAWTGAVYAWLLLECGLADDAADEAGKALLLAEQSGNQTTLSWAVNVLGNIFWYCKQLERAQVLCERAVEIARAAGDTCLLGWWLVNLAGVHAEIGCRKQREGDRTATDSLSLAVAINQESLAIARSLGDHWAWRLTLANAAEYLIALGELVGAGEMLEEWASVPGTPGERATAHYLYTKGQLMINQGRLDEALAVCINALDLAEAKHHAESEAYALRYLSQIYEKMACFEIALDYFKRFHDAQERVSAEKTQRRARFAEIHYKTEHFKRLAETARRQADEMALSSMRDPLTGLGNRRQLDETMASLRSEAATYAIVMVDLDHFKAINDRFSHMVGDLVLKRVAEIFRCLAGVGDVVARAGGEEFVILLRCIDQQTAALRCIALREGIEEDPWSEIHPDLRVTASIGVAFGERGSDPMTVMMLADQQLYRAKAGGRNCVVGLQNENGVDAIALRFARECPKPLMGLPAVWSGSTHFGHLSA